MGDKVFVISAAETLPEARRLEILGASYRAAKQFTDKVQFWELPYNDDDVKILCFVPPQDTDQFEAILAEALRPYTMTTQSVRWTAGL